MEQMSNSRPLLEMRDLRVLFPIHKKWYPAVDGVTFSVAPGEICGIVGESGSGKSVMSQSILRLRDHDTDVRYEGEILFENENLLKRPLKKMRDLRGNKISVIFQDPLTSLSPVHTIEKQLCEVLRIHKKISRKEAAERAMELLSLTGIPDVKSCLDKYPFELSGGMQQRVMIAMALACEPKLLIADEPTTALDVTIQEQILHLIKELNQKLNMSILFITHDMGAVANLCDSVKVMYLGQVVEDARKDILFANPLHPYTKGLLSCIPHLGVDRNQELPTIAGTVAPITQIPAGCHFCPRCEQAMKICQEKVPPLVEIEKGHFVKCFRFSEENKNSEGTINSEETNNSEGNISLEETIHPERNINSDKTILNSALEANHE